MYIDLARAKSEAIWLTILINRKTERSIDLILISKIKFACAALFFVFLRPFFALLQYCFAQLKRQTSSLHIVFMGELSYVLAKDFVSFVHDNHTVAIRNLNWYCYWKSCIACKTYRLVSYLLADN